MISAQQEYPDQMVAFIDIEFAFDIEYAQKLGLDTSEERFLLVQPDSANQALDLLLKFTESSLFSLVVLDSIPALVPEQNLNSDVGDMQVASLGRLLSNELRRVMIESNKTNTAVLLINQWRAGIGFGQPEKVMPGGAALKYYPSVIIELKRKDLIRKGENIIGLQIQANFTKNRFGAPYRKALFNLYFGEGIRKSEEAVEVAKDLGIISGKGWYTYPITANETGRLQGIENVTNWYKDNPEAFAYLESLVKDSFKSAKENVIESDDEETIDNNEE